MPLITECAEMNGNNQSEACQSSLKTVPLSLLRAQLNAFYRQAKFLDGAPRRLRHFNILWDLKEQALIEGKAAIDIPQDWLQELDLVDASTVVDDHSS